MLEAGSPDRLGLSESRLQRVDDWLQQQVSGGRLAGASVMIGRHGKVGYFGAAGLADLDQESAFTRDSIVRIYSMTKPVTTVAAMMLYERGHFQLDDPVLRYIPEFADTPVWCGGNAPVDNTEKQRTPITVRQLMNHTSGLTYGFMQSTPVDAYYRENGITFQDKKGSLKEMVNQLARAPLLCQPGTQWNYSVATDVLGRLVEIWSGKTLRDYFVSEILEPLKMHDTDFSVAENNVDRFTAMYAPKGGGGLGNVGRIDTSDNLLPKSTKELELLESAQGSDFTRPTEMYSGGGGLTGTIDDYARFCQPVWSETNYEGIGFGLGFAVVLDPVKAQIITSIGECHWGGAASTFFWLDRKQQLFTVFFTQLMPSSTYPLRRELRSLVYQSIVA